MKSPNNNDAKADHVSKFIQQWWSNATHPETPLDTSDWILCFTTMTGMLVDIRAKDRTEAEVITKAIMGHMGEGILRFYDQSKRTLN
jgi:hypothetical protein